MESSLSSSLFHPLPAPSPRLQFACKQGANYVCLPSPSLVAVWPPHVPPLVPPHLLHVQGRGTQLPPSLCTGSSLCHSAH